MFDAGQSEACSRLGAMRAPLSLLRAAGNTAKSGEFLSEHFDEVVEGHDAEQGAARLDDRQAAHAVATHDLEHGQDVRIVTDCHEFRGGDLADLESAEGFRRVCHRADHDVAVRQDTERNNTAVEALDDDDVADTKVTHESSCRHEWFIRADDDDLSDANLAGVHATEDSTTLRPANR